MLKMTTAVVTALAIMAAGCSKKEEEGTVQKPMEGTTTAPPPAPPESTKPLEGAALADAYKTCIGLVNAGNLDEFRKTCVADAYVGHHMETGMETKGADALMAMFQDLRTAYPDLKLEPQIIGVSGRNILAMVRTTGTNTGAMKGPSGEAPATNKPIGFLMFHRLAMNEENRVSEEWTYADAMTMLGQLGLSPAARPVRPVMDKGIEGAPIVAVTADDAKEKANLELVQKNTAAFNAGNIAEAIAMYAPDAVEHDASAPADVTGAKEIEKAATMWFGAFSDAKTTHDHTWAAGDYVFATGKFTGTHAKPLGKIKKTGKSVALDFATVYRIVDGKIAHVWRFTSGAQLAQQLGLGPAPGASAPPSGSPAPAQ